MIAYFLLFICITFFFNKENKYINNTFVKSHVKTAFLLHILFLLVYIVFISFNVGRSLSIIGLSLNSIIASALFIGLFGILMYGMYQAHKWNMFTFTDVLTLTKTKNIIANEAEENMSEEDKLGIILWYVPFIGFFTFGRNIASIRLSEIVQLNLIVSLIIWFFYVSGANNFAIFVTLLYIVFVVYCAITLIGKDEVVTVSMKHIPTPTEKYIWLQTLVPYLYKHIIWKETPELHTLYQSNKTKYYTQEKQRQEEQKQKKEMPLPVVCVYLPVINILCLPFVKGKYKYHIISGVILSLCIIVSIVAFPEQKLLPLFALFPLSFGLGYRKRLGYQTPFIYDVYKVFAHICYTITHVFSKGRKIQKTVVNETINMKTSTPSDSGKNQ